MEGDAGTRQLNPTDADETPDESLAVSTEDQTDQATEPESPEPAEEAGQGAGDGRRPPRLGAGWVVGVCAGLLVLAAGAAAGGYLALRSHDDSAAIGRADAAALQAAKDCVAATQAPDTAAMIAAQSKIIECATGASGVQPPLYASVAAHAHHPCSTHL